MAVEWCSGGRPHGPRLASRRLKRAQLRLRVPGQPRLGGGKDRGARLLQRYAGLSGMAPRVEAGGAHPGEHTGDVGAMLGAIKQRVVALADAQLPGARHQIVIPWSTWDG